jgi:hypothetical protein
MFGLHQDKRRHGRGFLSNQFTAGAPLIEQDAGACGALVAAALDFTSKSARPATEQNHPVICALAAICL